MIAGISEGLLAGLNPKVAHKVWMSLDGVSLVVVVSGVDQLETKVVPY